MRSSEYMNYFRQLAVRHKDLQHDPATETGNGPAGKKRFARFSIEELLGGIHMKVTFPALLVDQYEYNTQDQGSGIIDDRYAGAFTVFATADPERPHEIEAAFDLAENIVEDILRQMYQDHYGDDVDNCQAIFEDLDFNGINMLPVGPVLDKQFGWRCEFNFKKRTENLISTPPAAGTFL